VTADCSRRAEQPLQTNVRRLMTWYAALLQSQTRRLWGLFWRLLLPMTSQLMQQQNAVTSRYLNSKNSSKNAKNISPVGQPRICDRGASRTIRRRAEPPTPLHHREKKIIGFASISGKTAEKTEINVSTIELDYIYPVTMVSTRWRLVCLRLFVRPIFAQFFLSNFWFYCTYRLRDWWSARRWPSAELRGRPPTTGWSPEASGHSLLHPTLIYDCHRLPEPPESLCPSSCFGRRANLSPSDTLRSYRRLFKHRRHAESST